MSDIISGLRSVIEDLVAPNLKAIQAKQESMDSRVTAQLDAVMKTLEAFRAEMRSEFAALRAQNQVELLRETAPIRERVSSLEARR